MSSMTVVFRIWKKIILVRNIKNVEATNQNQLLVSNSLPYTDTSDNESWNW